MDRVRRALKKSIIDDPKFGEATPDIALASHAWWRVEKSDRLRLVADAVGAQRRALAGGAQCRQPLRAYRIEAIPRAVPAQWRPAQSLGRPGRFATACAAGSIRFVDVNLRVEFHAWGGPGVQDAL